MPTENTSLKNTAPAGDSNTTNEMVTGKFNTYQRAFLIVAGSLLALLVLIAVVDTSGGQQLQSSTYEIAEGAVAIVDYQVGSANSALAKDIFDLGAISENNEGCNVGSKSGCSKCVGTCFISVEMLTQNCKFFKGSHCDCSKGCCDHCADCAGCDGDGCCCGLFSCTNCFTSRTCSF